MVTPKSRGADLQGNPGGTGKQITYCEGQVSNYLEKEISELRKEIATAKQHGLKER